MRMKSACVSLGKRTGGGKGQCHRSRTPSRRETSINAIVLSRQHIRRGKRERRESA